MAIEKKKRSRREAELDEEFEYEYKDIKKRKLSKRIAEKPYKYWDTDPQFQQTRKKQAELQRKDKGIRISTTTNN